MKGPKISVVVPVYNVEKCLSRCVNSIIDQTYKDIEIILVNDGSTDKSGKLCEDFAKDDKRIQVVHQKNAGLSAARNTGIEKSTGEYVLFVDSDDWIDKKTIELTLKVAQNNNANIVEFGFRSIYEKNTVYSNECSGKVFQAKPVEAILSNLKWDKFKPVPWNKLYARKVVCSAAFPVGKLHEDEFTTYKYYYAAKKICLLDIALYNYDRTRNESITAKFDERNLDACEAFLEKTRFILAHEDLKRIAHYAGNAYYYVLFEYLYRCRQNNVPLSKMKPTVSAAIKNKDIAETCEVDAVYQKCLKTLEKSLGRCLREWQSMR